MKRIILFLIQTNTHISVAAVAFMLANALLLNIPLKDVRILAAQIYFSTWFVYQLSRWLYHKKNLYEEIDDYVYVWFRKYPTISKIMIASSAICAFVLTFFLQLNTILLVAILGAVSVLYALPVLKPFGSDKRLRDIPFLKIFLIALVWSATSVLLPATEIHLSFFHHRELFLLFVTQFIFIFYITLPFDINDYQNDQSTNVKTIPTVFGTSVARIIMNVLFLVHAALLLYFYMIQSWNHIPNIFMTEIFYISIITVTFFLLLHSIFYAEKVHKWVIKLVYDSSMILYFIIAFFTIKHG